MRKLTSVKNILAFFAMAVVAYIVIAGKTEFMPLAEKMSFVLLAYCPCNVWQKKILGDKCGA